MGGGKSAPAPEEAKPINTTTDVGGMLDPKQEENTKPTTDKKEDAVKRKREGTRGLQIPNIRPAPKTAASTGVQI